MALRLTSSLPDRTAPVAAWLMLAAVTLAVLSSLPDVGLAAGQAEPAKVAATQPASRPATQPAPQASRSFLDEPEPRPLVTRPEGSSASAMWTMMASLLVILVLGAVAMVVLKRVLPKLGLRTGRRVQVLETTHLGPRKAVHLLQVGSQRFLIGSTREHISLLAEATMAFLDEGDEPADTKSRLDRKIRGS